ncbi:hypothetical protein F5Y02DRAFT_55464 [Annulohypoxylon stygium]|nr:hypothetical protein F5Y02DRAFT_55464 [Annulohypoxylon stygium]
MAFPTDNHPPDEAVEDLAAKVAACQGLLRRGKLIQSELQRFITHVEEAYSDYFQHMPTYVHSSYSSELRTEMESLEKNLTDLQSSNPKGLNHAQSSNLVFFESIWETAKKSRDIVRLRCAVFTGPFKKQILAPGTRIVRTQGQSQSTKSGSLIIDVVADGGHSWYKVSSMTNKRVLFDLAKEAIYWEDSDDDENGDAEAATQDYSDVPLIKLAKTLANTAQGYRIQSKSPTTFLILPRIQEGVVPEVDKILEVCRQFGVNVLCGQPSSPAQPLSDELLHTMAPSPKTNFTEVLNVDTSLLVALASDFSHTKVTKQPWFSATHESHTDLEAEQPMLSLVYPMIGNRKLVCTREAADTFFHIVDTLATDSEKARAYLVLSPDSGKSQEQRVKELQSFSVHPVPSHLQLPVSIIDVNESHSRYRLTDPVKKTLETLLNPGRSVFSYGWAAGLTTLTCNSVIVKQLEKDLEKLPTLGDLPWPSIWALPTSRPFVGIPRTSRKQVRKHIGDCSVSCTCGTDELYGQRSNVTII